MCYTLILHNMEYFQLATLTYTHILKKHATKSVHAFSKCGAPDWETGAFTNTTVTWRRQLLVLEGNIMYLVEITQAEKASHSF